MRFWTTPRRRELSAWITAFGPLLQGGCDPSNIGSKPQRMVRVAVQDQSFF